MKSSVRAIDKLNKDLKNKNLVSYKYIELEDMRQEDIQVVPEGVWARVFLQEGQLNLRRFSLAPRSRADGSAKYDLEVLEAGKHDTSVLQASESYSFDLRASVNRVRGRIEFYTRPSLYFYNKYNEINGIGRVHSDVSYFSSQFLPLLPDYPNRALRVLDIGCGRGRNLAIFIQDKNNIEHNILGIDKNSESLSVLENMAKTEGLSRLDTLNTDLNTWRAAEQHDVLMAIVSLQFLAEEAALELLRHSAGQANSGALHLLVFPVFTGHKSIQLPATFKFLPESESIRELYLEMGWSILEYREAYGHLGKRDKDGLPIRGLFATLVAQAAL